MRFHHAIIAALALCGLPSIEAFTNGEMLLPSYLCGPAQANADGTITGLDNKPKALGGVLTNLVEYTYANSKPQNGDGDFFYDPINDPMIFLGAMHNAKAAGMNKQFHGNTTERVPNAPLLNQGNQVDANAPLNVYNNKTIPIKAQTNVLGVVGITQMPPALVMGADTIPANNAPPIAGSTFTTITPNKLVLLSLQAKNDILGGNPLQNVFDPANGADNALDGAIVYAQNNKNQRVGKFASGGEFALPWTACGPDANGIVHTALLSGTNVYNGPTFFLPFDYHWTGNNPGITQITFMGAAVTDGGFGYHQTKWQVQPLPPSNININNLAKADRIFCQTQIFRACQASCYDCYNKAGSAPGNALNPNANGSKKQVNVQCQANPKIAGLLNIYTSVCTIKNQVTAVVPAGTENLPPAQAKDATGNDVPWTADEQAVWADAAASLIDNTTSTTCTTTNTNNNANANGNTVNQAITSTQTSFITILTVAASAFFNAARR